MVIMQGDSYPIMISLVHDAEVPLTPEMVEEVEVTVGEGLILTHSSGGVLYDAVEGNWYIHPSQEQTFALATGTHQLLARVKYRDTPRPVVVGIEFDTNLHVRKSNSKEVL